MNVFYEEDGGFKVAHVMSDIGTSLQVESVTGKRSKIKSSAVILRFDSALGEFLPAVDQAAAGIDPQFLWDVSGDAEFGCEQMAEEYFGHKPGAIESAAVAQKLHASPMYFYKRGKGRYQKAPEQNLKAALASIERKQREAAQMAGWVAQLRSGVMPEELRPHRDTLLYRPDRNTLMAKATEQAVAESQVPLPQLFFAAGAWPDRDNAHYQFHLGRFLHEYFPKGRAPTDDLAPAMPPALPRATVRAFSIDDAGTTEIDDAFSLTALGDGAMEIGIHIAAPALFAPPGSALEAQAAERLSTVYFPGDKITMFPESMVAAATLAAGRAVPVVSCYATFDAQTFALAGIRSVVEEVEIAANLRIGELESRFHEDSVAAGRVDGPFGAELLTLHRAALALAQRRSAKDDLGERVDFNIDVVDGRVAIAARRRGNPVDTLVSELMILANSEWGKLLADNSVAAIYRTQLNGKTRISTDALPHEGLGVAQYAWTSSPLRRYVDLVNQRQLIAYLNGEAPPYSRRSRDSLQALGELARRFDLTYDAYNEFQRNLERYWCLRYLAQEGLTRFEGSIIRDELVRASAMPLVVKLTGNPELPPKTAVTVEAGELDFWSIGGRFALVS
ncbi:MAG TPA: RNB domain-containing ribonuclease [Usitatibacteraceae bacterium]|nr:RNB domain-containing ribonuclease [Usitatibacteraceae bacterium]